jgi:hypothetical protein
MPETSLAPLALRDLNRATLARQMLLAREKTKPLRAIERMVGLQSQWPKPPHVGLWSRVEGFAREDLLGLLRGRDAVRATMMRGTLHVVGAKDFVSLRAALQPMLTRGLLGVLRERAKGIDVDEVRAHASRILARGPQTFEEVREALARIYPKGDHRAIGYIARMTVPLVQVPTDDAWGFPTDPAFALAEDWLGEKLSVAEDARSALVLRYLAAYGPGTAVDVQTWSGLQGLKDTFDALRPRLVALRDERKRELFDLPKAPRPGGEVVAPPRFLPEFDSLVMAHKDRTRFVADAHRRNVYLSALRVAPTVLVDGFVAATWGIKRARAGATLTITPFAPLAKRTQAAVGDEGERLLRFLEPDAKAFDLAFAKKSAAAG